MFSLGSLQTHNATPLLYFWWIKFWWFEWKKKKINCLNCAVFLCKFSLHTSILCLCDDLLTMGLNSWPLKMNSRPTWQSVGSFRAINSFGLIRLQNLRNTCYMNHAIQYLVLTLKLVDYFLKSQQIHLEGK